MDILEIQNKIKRQEAYLLSLMGEEIDLRNRYRNTPCGFHSDEEYQEALNGLHRAIALNDLNRNWKIISRLPAEYDVFVGRRDELRQIRSAFDKKQSPVWLCGLGGIGKSALAAAYLQQNKDRYDQILHLTYDRSIRDLVEDDSILPIRGLSFNNNFFGSRLRYFRVKFEALKSLSAQYRTLILLDNCDDPDFAQDRYLADFLNLPCDILVTSRKRPDKNFDAVIQVGPLPESMLDLFIDRYSTENISDGERERIHRFASRIGYLTLPLAIRVRNKDMPEDNILTGLGLLEKYDLKKNEIQALLYLAVMPAQGMPEYLYLEWTGESEEILEKLEQKMLIRRTPGPVRERMLQIHPLIAEKVKEILPPTVSNCKQYLIRLYDYVQGSSLSEKENGRDGKNTWSRSREENQREAPYILTLLKIFRNPVPWLADGCDALVIWLWIMRYDEMAEDYSLKLYQSVYEFYGSNHPITAKMALRTAAMYWNTGRKEDSYRWYHLGYDIIHRAPYDNSQYLAVCFSAAEKLATNVYAEQGNLKLSSMYLEEALNIWNRPDYPRDSTRRSPVFVMRQQCSYLMQLGQLEKADALWQELEALAPEWLRQRASWLPFLEVQAELLDAKGEQAAAIDVTEKMLEMAEIHSIGTHKEMILAREKAGDRYRKYGLGSRAAELYKKTEELLLENYPNETEWLLSIQKKKGE